MAIHREIGDRQGEGNHLGTGGRLPIPGPVGKGQTILKTIESHP
jgi:hypothetical protein